jgi:N-acetylglucosamine-6-phosphate deacetylase
MEENRSADEQRVIEGNHFRTGEQIILHIQGGCIAEIGLAEDENSEPVPWIGPGLVDLQVNGYGGMDFNSVPLDEQLVQRVTRALWREGVTTYLPTIITNSDEAIEEAMRTIAQARSEDAFVKRTVAGIHLEGPFVSAEDGPRGAHDRAYVKAPDWSLFQRWQEAAEGCIEIITLSPEWPGSTAFINECVESGVTVSLGHTAATPEQIREAVAAGARMSTHLGNGAHPTLPRHPNYIWEQLAQDDLWATVIADGFHLPESVLKVVFRVKGPKAMLVSDAVAFSGVEPGEYDTHVGGKVVLTPEGRLHLADNPELLAGSAQVLRQGVEHLLRSRLSSFPEAWEMASIRPASFMGLPAGSGLSVSAPADLVVFNRADNGEVSILRTYENGELVYDRSG